MEIYVVRRDSVDGLEVDCFLDLHNAETWAKATGNKVEVENTLDDVLPDLLRTV